MAIPDVNLQELNIKSSMILHSISTIEITSYKDLEENTAEDFYEPGTVLA